MRYRRNSDTEIRQLEQTYLATGDIDDLLRYRRALARMGHREALIHQRGIFILSASGSTGIEYIKKFGPTYAIVVSTFKLSGEEGLSITELEKKKGSRQNISSERSKSWNIVIPPILVDHINTIKNAYFRGAISKLEKEYGKTEDKIGGMAIFAMTQRPHYQEGLYKLVVGELEGLGYFQAVPIEEAFCISECGRSMGLLTPARSSNQLCFYCWQKKYNFDQKWLDGQLTYHGSYAPQLRRNPLDEEIRNLELQTIAGDPEACLNLIRTYEKISGSENYGLLLEIYLSHLLATAPHVISNCDVHPVASIAPVYRRRTSLREPGELDGFFTLITVVQKYDRRKGLYLANCCELNQYYDTSEEAQVAAKAMTKEWSLEDPLQLTYLHWRGYMAQYENWISDPQVKEGTRSVIERFAGKPDEEGSYPYDEVAMRFERSLMREDGLSPPENLSWDINFNPYSIELLIALIIVNGPNIEEMHHFLLPNQA